MLRLIFLRKIIAGKRRTVFIRDVATHLKRTIHILILIFILSSCQNEKKLSGTWLSAYEYNAGDSSKKPTTGIPFNQVISFSNETFEIKEFRYDWYEDQQTNEYKLVDDKLIIAENKAQFSDVIDPITRDSLVFNSQNSPLNRVYKRLPDSLKNQLSDFTLAGKKFIRNYRQFTDTIEFINDSVYTSSALKIGGESDLMWERINHNGFDILFTDGFVPFVLKKKVGEEISVSTFQYAKEDFVLKEIK